MKFFTALLATESNTFVSVPTGWGGFNDYGIFHGDASTRDAAGLGMIPLELRKLLAAEGHELVESLTTFAQPLGRTVRAVYESLRDEILADMRRAGAVDGVILVLHGAMVAEGYDDCEGDLISRVRAIVGPKVPIGGEFDLHCHFTRQMMTESDVIVGYKEYPHTDVVLCLRELARIVVDTAQGRVQPVTAVHDCRMVGMWHTTREPMAGFVRRTEACEKRPGVLSVSLGHGFPWADVPESGVKLWVVTDDDPALAAQLADELGRAFWDLRHQTGTPSHPVDRALDEAMNTPGDPVAIADMAFGGVWDLGAVQMCREAMARRAAKHGVALRPHLKTAKSVEVAHRATREPSGAITVSTMAEADYFARHGFRDLTYAVGINASRIEGPGLAFSSGVHARPVERIRLAQGRRRDLRKTDAG